MNLVKINKNLDIIIKSEIQKYINPDYIYVPVKNGYDLLVKQNEKISLSQTILKSNNNIMVSPISGKVVGIKKISCNNLLMNSLVIKNDFQERNDKEIENINTKFSKKELIKKLRHYDYKYIANILENKKIENIVINGIDDEPYIYNNSFILKEYSKEILKIIDLLSETLKISTPIITFKSIDTKNCEKFMSILGTYPNMKISLVDDKYLISKKPFLLEFLNLKDENTIILDIEELFNIYNAIYYDRYPCEKFITISGQEIEKSIVIRVKLGTLIKDIIDNNITLKKGKNIFILNSLLSGVKINIDNEIIVKDTKGIIIIKDMIVKEEKCNNCGLCVKICPVKINPKKIMDTKIVNKKCLDCGLCTYICPSFINLRRYLKGDKDE